MSVEITGVQPGSLADRAGIQSGDSLLSINGSAIGDVLDYRFYATDARVVLMVETASGKQRRIKLKNKEYQELGLEFASYLMDKKRSCKNNCIFCFINQLPKGMRKTLYFKDDDDRLSFLFGNYITLTNVTEQEIARIIKMRISPINVSVHTTNPQLRASMMRNPHAGEALRFLPQLAQAGIALNCQLVLCPGINDGLELRRTLHDLERLFPSLQSIACVPVGLTDYRQNLPDLRPYDQSAAREVIATIEEFGDRWLDAYGSRVVYPADEFFLKAALPVPPAPYYDEFSQLENGIGLMAYLKDGFERAYQDVVPSDRPLRISVATGVAARDFISGLIDELKQKWHNLICPVYPIVNDYFGHQIVVSGLVTGQDLVNQLKGKPLGDRLLLPSAMLDSENQYFLDSMTPAEVEQQLEVPLVFVNNEGADLIDAVHRR